MKNLALFFCFAIGVFASCDKVECEGLPTQPCLEATLETFKLSSNAVSILTQEINCNTHYWLNTNDRFFDGTEYILNGQCDTVCWYGGFSLPLPCLSDYNMSDWETIWQK